MAMSCWENYAIIEPLIGLLCAYMIPAIDDMGYHSVKQGSNTDHGI